jgi:hypothetical protein
VLLQVFFREILQRARCLFQPTSTMFQLASVRRAHMTGVACVRCSLGGVAVHRAPRAWARSRRSGRTLRLVFERPFAVPPRDGG